MTRLRRIEKHDRIFFVTTNLRRRVADFSSAERDLILKALDVQRNRGELLLFGFAVMDSHVHLLLCPQNKDLIGIMRNFKSRTGYDIAHARGVHGPLWQERYFDVIMRRVRDFWQKLEYIHRNPVEAGLVERAGEWRWSSYNHYVTRGASPIPVDPVDLPADENQFLWPAPWR